MTFRGVLQLFKILIYILLLALREHKATINIEKQFIIHTFKTVMLQFYFPHDFHGEGNAEGGTCRKTGQFFHPLSICIVI